MSIVSDTVASAVRAVDGMRDMLEELNKSIVKAQKNRSFESRLGRLFLEAQDFLDHVRAETSEWANRVLEDARAEAAEIVRVARDEAAQIVDEARRSSVSPEAVQSIQTTIQTFNRANAELARELTRLGEVLSQPRPQDSDAETYRQSQLRESENHTVQDQTRPSVGAAEPHWAGEVRRILVRKSDAGRQQVS